MNKLLPITSVCQVLFFIFFFQSLAKPANFGKISNLNYENVGTMAYQSLYRKYRSRGFNDLIGQQHVTHTLANALHSDRVSHAYLFCGPRGTGKTSTARVLAKAVNCVNGPTEQPCDVCDFCVAIRTGTALDVVEIDAASNRNIDDIRNLREQVNYPPVELRKKFYIVDEVHQLTRDSFNAFLKTLEEPPAHVVFVLCTTDPHQLPATILSRCQRFDFHRITREDIVGRLRFVTESEGWTIEEEALQLLTRAANGGMRDALSLLDQASSYAGQHITARHVRDILGGIDLDLLIEFGNVVLTKNAPMLFTLLDRIMAEGKDVPQLVGELVQHWRNLLRVIIAGRDSLIEFSDEQRDEMAKLASITNQFAVMRAISLLCEAENELRWNSQQRLALELSFLRIMADEPVAQIAAPAPAPVQRPAYQAKPAPVQTYQPDMQENNATPAAKPQPRQQQPTVMIAPEATSDSSNGEITIADIKKRWPQFLDWMGKNPQLEKMKSIVMDKVVASELNGGTLILTTPSPFARDQVLERPKVKEVCDKCVSTFFRSTITIKVELDKVETQTQVAESPAAAQEIELLPPPEHVEETAPVNNRDIVGERMKEVFPNSVEISDENQ
jgi:DNA polymerase-3 subunit gamma/tau